MRTSSSSISPKRPAALHALGIGGELAQRLDIGREPGEPVGGALLAVEQVARDAAALRHHPLARPRGVASASSASTAPAASRGTVAIRSAGVGAGCGVRH